MADFNVTSQIFDYVDGVVATFVSDNISEIVAFATPIVALGLTISLMIQGLMSMTGSGDEPLVMMIKNFIRYVIICGIAAAGGLYQSSLVQIVQKTPDEFASVLVMSGDSMDKGAGLSSTVDKVINAGLKATAKAFKNADLSGSGIASVFLGTGIFVVTLVIAGLGTGMVLMAKVLLGIMAALGPIFIFCLLFDSLKDYFSRWVGACVNYGLITILLAAVFGLILKFFEKSVAAAATDNSDTPLMVALASCCLVMFVGWFILKEIPNLAASMGAGAVATFRGLRGPRPAPSKGPDESPAPPSPTPSPQPETGGKPGEGGASSNPGGKGNGAASGLRGMAKGSMK